MEKRNVEENCERLFEQLKSILYDKKPKQLEMNQLDPEFQKLGQGLAYMQAMIMEMVQYSSEISQGNLNPAPPSPGNLLCSNLKNLKSNLQHLTWQAEQVAKGDYTQHVSYLGAFSDSFNLMIDQLKERDEAIKRRTALMEEYNRFFLEVSNRKDEWIYIVDANERSVRYCNRQEEQDPFIISLLQDPETDHYHQQEVWNEKNKFFEISAFRMEWQGEKAVSYIVKDITKEKEHSDNLTKIAYNDALTGMKNRQFFDEYLKNPEFFEDWDVFCFMDLDGLKRVNDVYGHEAGDVYIQSFAEVLQQSFRSTDYLIRLGGDEFCLFCKNLSLEILEKKLEIMRSDFIKNNKEVYEVSFRIISGKPRFFKCRDESVMPCLT